ncbi:MAG: DUF7662 domain-containing protein [Rhizomicrobium sp.]
MGKYDPLGEYLRAQMCNEVAMSFADIERVIGSRLPPKAQFHRAWWSNNPANNVMTKVWRNAGFMSERVDVGGRTLVFKRVETNPERVADIHGHARGVADDARESIPAEAKDRTDPYRSPLFGAMKGTFALVPPRDDEPPPEDPYSWEALTLAKLDRLLFGKGE